MKTLAMVNLLNQNQPESPWTINPAFNDGYPILSSNLLNAANFTVETPNVVVFPTITKDLVTIVSSANLVEVSLYSISGSLVKSKKLNGVEVFFDVNGLESGIYFLLIRTEKGISTHKIIKR